MITPLKQSDPRWGSKPLGYGAPGITLSSDGCLFVALLMLVCHDRTFQVEWVDSFSACLKDPAHANYTPAGGALLQKWDVSACHPTAWGSVKLVGTTGDIKTHLRTVGPAIVEVDPMANKTFAATVAPAMTKTVAVDAVLRYQHFVLAIGMAYDGSILIADPLYGDIATLARYGNVTYSQHLYQISLSATPPPVPDVPPHPVPEFRAQPATITAGQSADLHWSIEGVEGVWLDGQGVPGVMSTTVHPAVTTTYTLRVQYRDKTYMQPDAKVTLTVIPAPVPPPSARRVGLGVHVLTSVKGIQQAQAADCQVFMVMNRPDEACALATGDPTKWYSGCGYPLVMYRIYHETNPWSPADMVGQLAGLTENPNPNKKNVIITLANEWDVGIPGAGNSAAGMSKFCDWTIDCVNRLHAKGLDNVAIFSASVGTPEFNDAGVCDAIRAKIAPLWNNGAIRWLDYHSYSPTMQHIYNTTGDEAWYEARWRFFYTKCGFDPNAPGRIVSSETGMDEGGIGGVRVLPKEQRKGFMAHQASRLEVLNWCIRYLQIQQVPIVVNGQSYPSPFMAGTLFQADPDDVRWQGYRVNGYFPLTWSLA